MAWQAITNDTGKEVGVVGDQVWDACGWWLSTLEDSIQDLPGLFNYETLKTIWLEQWRMGTKPERCEAIKVILGTSGWKNLQEAVDDVDAEYKKKFDREPTAVELESIFATCWPGEEGEGDA